MQKLILFLWSTFFCANLISAHYVASPKNRLGTHIHVMFGGHISAFYERRFNDVFAIEVGAVGGENFLGQGLSRLTHVGPYLGANLYLTNINAHHHFYFSPSLATTYGRAKIVIPRHQDREQDWEDLQAIALNGSVYFIYRYLFKFGLNIETGIGVDAVHVLFPLARNKSVRTYSLPIPKIELGLSYAF